jgi:hypothetical protein
MYTFFWSRADVSTIDNEHTIMDWNLVQHDNAVSFLGRSCLVKMMQRTLVDSDPFIPSSIRQEKNALCVSLRNPTFQRDKRPATHNFQYQLYQK